MSLKRTVQYWRIGFIAISIMILLSVSRCSDTHLEDEQVVESEIAVQDQQQNVKDNEDEIIEICSQLYKKASEENKIADLETVSYTHLMADERTEKQKVQEITDKLEEGLKELFESEKYKTYLSTMSKSVSYTHLDVYKRQMIISHRGEKSRKIISTRWQKGI